MFIHKWRERNLLNHELQVKQIMILLRVTGCDGAADLAACVNRHRLWSRGDAIPVWIQSGCKTCIDYPSIMTWHVPGRGISSNTRHCKCQAAGCAGTVEAWLICMQRYNSGQVIVCWGQRYVAGQGRVKFGAADSQE